MRLLLLFSIDQVKSSYREIALAAKEDALRFGGDGGSEAVARWCGFQHES
jgi:hypothetical protein